VDEEVAIQRHHLTDLGIHERCAYQQTHPSKSVSKGKRKHFAIKWSKTTRGKQAEKLGDTIRMLKVARKYNVDFTPVQISKNLKGAMPTWLHIGHQKRVS
jgi:hypothetical protein